MCGFTYCVSRMGLISLVASLAGCGTLFGGTTQVVTFTSRPEGAEVMVNAQSIGQTPMQYRVSKSTFSDRRVTIRHDGYETKEFRMGKTLEAIALLNCTSWLSWGTDALTGGMIEYDPDAYFVELRPTTVPAGDDTALAALTETQREELAYVLGTHRPLLVDIARGEGEYLRTLAIAMRVPQGRYAPFVEAVRAELPVLMNQAYPYRLYAELLRIIEREQLSTAQRVPMFPPSSTLIADAVL